MNEPYASRLLIAAPPGAAAKLCDILAAAQIEPVAVYAAGGEAVAALEEPGTVLLACWRLSDMDGAELARHAEAALLIVPGDCDPEALKDVNALTLRNPISPDALVQAVRAMCYCTARMQTVQQKAQRFERMLAERKVIERAKGRLMDTLHLSESEAHYRMQKQSMDTGRRIVDVAQEILDGGEIAS